MNLENPGELLLSFLNHHFELVFFLVLGLGYIVGNIRIKSFSLGPVAGVLFVGLVFGYFGFRISSSSQMVGFALFIFSVGYQAGPGFVAVLKQDGLKYLGLAVVVSLSGFAAALLWAKGLSLPPGMSAGLLSGGLTSSPTLAAAQDAVHSGSITLPEGWTEDQIIDNIAMGYALTYIIGLITLIIMIKYLPKFLKIDLVKEAAVYESANSDGSQLPENIVSRTYRIVNAEVEGKSVEALKSDYWDQKSVVKVKRTEGFVPIGESGLKVGDTIEVMASYDYFTQQLSKIAEEITPEVRSDNVQETTQIIVQNEDVAGVTLESLAVQRRFGVFLSRIHREGRLVEQTKSTVLQSGDVLTVIGTAEQIETMGAYMGQVAQGSVETDMVTLSFGIAVGLIVGMLSVELGGISIGLGSAGGLLASGIFIGYRRSLKPTFGQLPEATRWFLMEFGLLLFMAGVGLRAGGGILETLQQNGLTLVVAAITVAIIPIVTGYFVGSKLLKIKPALIFGAITGAMTSGAALSVVLKEAKSPVPALGYTSTYAFANVFLAIAGSLIMMF